LKNFPEGAWFARPSKNSTGTPVEALKSRAAAQLRACGPRPLSATPSNQEVLFALAALGGHLRSNGPPGWIVLGRAFDKLLVIEQGWVARSTPRSDQ
jgi:hypothetical protein